MIFLIMILVILVFVVLWNYDLHKILFVKSVTRNAGDSAALAAARWQGISLNIVGDLNILHALAIDSGNAAAESSITNMQARLSFVGPMIAFISAQQAAKNNKVYVNEEFSEWLRDHATEVRNIYPAAVGPDGEPLFPEPYPGAWNEYADMLELAASDGVVAGPDNMRLYTDYGEGAHILLMKGFYEAIAGLDWCWFYRYAPTLLDDYDNFFPCWWSPLPEIPSMEYINSEIFSLGLTKVRTSVSALGAMDAMSTAASAKGFGAPSWTATNAVSVWYCYDRSLWTTWNAMSTTGPDAFPLTGRLKPQYDYAGADAAIRIEATADRVTPGSKGAVVENTITWSAAAKPFGYLNEADPPNTFGLVLPAFREVALIPIDAASSSSGGGYDLYWRKHVKEHLPGYLDNGPQPSACWYCRQLVTWENPLFREAGSDWLSTNSWKCTISTGGGGGSRGGGTRRGH